MEKIKKITNINDSNFRSPSAIREGLQKIAASRKEQEVEKQQVSKYNQNV